MHNKVIFIALKRELDKLDRNYVKDKEAIRQKLEDKSRSYFKVKEDLLKKLMDVCPHESETYHDDWHPHTRDGDEYYKCDLCGNKRKV